MQNPYEPPPPKDAISEAAKTAEPDASPVTSPSSPWPTLIWLIALMSAISAAYFVYLAMKLRSRFPDLHDPAPEVDGYWPGLFHDLYLLWAGAAGIFACALFVIANVLRRRLRVPVRSGD